MNSKLLSEVDADCYSEGDIPELGEALEVLQAIAEAKRFDRMIFADDEAFADWAQSLARHTLAHAKKST